MPSVAASGVEHLPRDRTVVPDVPRMADSGRALAPELLLELVAVGQGGREGIGRLGRDDLPERVLLRYLPARAEASTTAHGDSW